MEAVVLSLRLTTAFTNVYKMDLTKCLFVINFQLLGYKILLQPLQMFYKLLFIITKDFGY